MNGKMSKKILYVSFLVFLLVKTIHTQEKITVNDVSKLFNKGDFSAVVDLATKAIKEGADIPEFYYYLGMSYSKLTKNPEAIQFLKLYLNKADYSKNVGLIRSGFQEIVSIYKAEKDYSSIMEFGDSFLEKLKTGKDTQQIESFCKSILANLYGEIGNQKMTDKDYAGAIQLYKKVLEYRPNDVIFMQRIASCYKSEGKKEEAAEYYLMAAIAWKSWTSKVDNLLALVDLIWDEEKFEDYAKKSEQDSISYNFILAANDIKKHNYNNAFSRMKNIEDSVGSKGTISSRMVDKLSSKVNKDPLLFYSFIIAYPDHYSVVSMLDTLSNLGRNNPENAKLIRETFAPSLAKLIDENPELVSLRKLFGRIVDLKFLGIPENDKTATEKIGIFEEFRKKYPDDAAVADIIRREASLYVDVLRDYKNGKDLYEILVKKYNQKNFIPQLAKCLINLGENEQGFILLKDFLSGENIGEYAKFQAGQLLIQANYFDEGVRVLTGIISTTKNSGLKRQAEDILKGFRQYLKEDITFETTVSFVVLDINQKQYYYTNFISITKDDPVLFQESETIDIVPFSKDRKTITCTINCLSNTEISFTEPHALIFKENGSYVFSLRKTVPFMPDCWRKPGGVSLIFPWQDLKTENIRVVRDCAIESETGISTTMFKGLKQGMKVEVYFSGRAGRFISVFPESSDSVPGGTMAFYPSTDTFEIKINFKPNSDVLAYYPKIKISEETVSESMVDSIVSEFSLDTQRTSFNILFNEEIKVRSVLRRSETIYEIDEKIDL